MGYWVGPTSYFQIFFCNDSGKIYLTFNHYGIVFKFSFTLSHQLLFTYGAVQYVH
jgi:hypothetical protein